ncbi:MAG: dephospho-CoA kinase [Dehalococcoidia bacterium]
MPLVIGVTGSIASGKSLACSTLVELGAVHCNADTLVHRLYDPGTPGFERVVAAFGADVVGADGYVDRRVLGSKVFGKPEAMRQLTRAMGDISGAIKAEIDRWRETLPADSTGVMEAVNLIEPGYSAWCDTTWLVACNDETALPRLMARNDFSEAEAKQRLGSQRPWQQRAAAADLVLHNNNGRAEFVETVRYAYRRLWELRQSSALPRSHYHTWRAANPVPTAVPA